MHNYILQDWITIRGASSTTVTQSESTYLDLAPYQDILFYLDCRELTGSTPTIAFQTSPTKEDFLFQACVAAFNLTTSPSNPYRVILNASSTPSVPLARFVRWQIAGPASTWDATFRVLVACNALGL
jgi:hypothetical protein